MNKKEQIVTLAEKLDTTQKEAERIYNIFCDLIEQGAKESDEFRLGKVLYFKKKQKPDRMYRNPKTGEEIFKPAHMTVTLKKGTAFKEKKNA